MKSSNSWEESITMAAMIREDMTAATALARGRIPELDRMVLAPGDTLLNALRVIEEAGQEIAFVCEGGRRLVGTLTDGDIRRALLRGFSLHKACVSEAMCRKFSAVPPSAGRAEVLDLMRALSISQVPIVDAEWMLLGLHTLRDLLGTGKRPNAAVIMAGGKGTRLRPLTESIPKPMISVAGRPMLERLVLHLVGAGITELYISINFLGHMVEEHFGDGSAFGCSIRYLREDQPLGTGGCLSLLPEAPQHPMLVMNGDLVTQADIGGFLEYHDRGGYFATMGVRPYAVDIPFGVAVVDEGRLVRVREKPREEFLINAGMYVLSPEAVASVPLGIDFPITDLFQAGQEDRPLGAFVVEQDWLDVGQPEQLLRANGRV